MEIYSLCVWDDSQAEGRVPSKMKPCHNSTIKFSSAILNLSRDVIPVLEADLQPAVFETLSYPTSIPWSMQPWCSSQTVLPL